jgi:hypothetical protein
MIAASIVLPRPTSSAMRIPDVGESRNFRTGLNWYASACVRDAWYAYRRSVRGLESLATNSARRKASRGSTCRRGAGAGSRSASLTPWTSSALKKTS